MDKDMLLAKSPLPEGWIDMGIGEAATVREALMSTFRSLKAWSPSRKTNFSYQEPRGLPRLVKILSSTHQVPVTVTVGAKNGLFLVFKALKRMGFSSIVSSSPYWTSFPAIANEAGVDFLVLRRDIDESSLDPSSHVLLVTSPNNPDSLSTKKKDLEAFKAAGIKIIHDAVYSTRAYGADFLEDLEADVQVFSAAKQFGLSGARVGWVATSWKDLDSHLQDLNETITSGVCVLAQGMVADVLSLIKENPESAEKFYKESSDALRINREAFVTGLGGSIPKEVSEEILARKGMFIWVPEKYLNLSAQVRFVNGSAFGAPGWIRLSIGNVTPTESRLAGERLGRTDAV